MPASYIPSVQTNSGRSADNQKTKYSQIGVIEPQPSPISYDGYLMGIFSVDSEWTLPKSDNRGESGSTIFDRIRSTVVDVEDLCTRYATEICENQRNFVVANEKYLTEYDTSVLDKRSFHPLHYVPFGHADLLSVALFDDFDPIPYIASELQSPLEEVSLAFCPTVTKNNIDVNNKRVSALELFDGRDDLGHDDLNGSSIIHRIQHELPLLCFTRLKLAALVSLGGACESLPAAISAIDATCRSTVQTLREMWNESHPSRVLFTIDDLDKTKIVITRLLGGEELGVLVFCNNLSVALSMVAGIEKLTLGDLDDHGAAGLSSQSNGNSRSSLEKALFGNFDYSGVHAIRWIQSTVAISPHLFCSDSAVTDCQGYVKAQIRVQVSPGHHGTAARKIIDKHSEIESGEFVDLDRDSIQYYRVGTTDLVYDIQNHEREERLCHSNSAFETVKQIHREFEYQKERGNFGRDVTEIQTEITVPIPLDSNHVYKASHFVPGIPHNHDHPLGRILPNIHDRLFRSSTDQTNESPLIRLRRIPKTYGLPMTLRRAIESMYQNYCLAVTDPVLFDSVIDLYQVLDALYRVLTRHIPEKYASEIAGTNGDTRHHHGILDDELSDQIATLTSSISNSISHRLFRAHPEFHVRDIDIDHRGGIQQLSAASEVLIKNSFSLLEKYGHRNGRRLTSVAGIIRRGLAPIEKNIILSIGRKKGIQLSIFDISTPHIQTVDSYLNLLHESFHILFDGIEVNDKIFNTYLRRNPTLQDRINEVGAHSLMFIYAFRFDRNTFVNTHIRGFYRNISNKQSIAIAQIYEYSLRLFLATEISVLPEKTLNESSYKIRLREIVSAYEKFKDEIIAEIPSQILENPQDTKHAHWYFDRRFKDDQSNLVHWIHHLSRHIEHVTGKMRPIHPPYWDSICQTIDDHISAGQPVGMKDVVGTVSSEDLDLVDFRFQFCCALLYVYCKKKTHPSPKNFFLSRNHDSTRVEYPCNGVEWSRFQVDAGSPHEFCAVPRARQDRLKMQIAVLESMYGIAADYREETFSKIIFATM